MKAPAPDAGDTSPRKRREAASAGERITFDANIPMHYQIYAQLRAEIKDGLWIGHRDFPGEVELADRFDVSVITSRRALERLAAEGWIDRGRGRRTVATVRPETTPLKVPVETFPTGRLRPFSYMVLSRKIGTAPAEACLALGAAPGSDLWLCSRLRSFEGRRHSVTLNVQHAAVGGRHSLSSLRQMPMPLILRQAGYRLARLTRRVAVSMPTPHVAAHLGITLNDPTLVFTFTIGDDKDTVIEWVRIYVHPNEPNPCETMNLETGSWRTDVAM